MDEHTVNKQRQYLNDLHMAIRDIELTDAAIDILERVTQTKSREIVVRSLKRAQQKHLARIDRASAKLGAPYK